MARRLATGLTCSALCFGFAACDTRPPPEPLLDEVDYVGAGVCAGCHVREAEAWSGSHHDRAMQEADEAGVLGDFANAVFSSTGETLRFFRQGDAFFVSTFGPEGERSDFRVRYTFGVEPLQQVLLELPGGRLQALTVAWDSREQREGGQRWFPLYPAEHAPPGDFFHWTGAAHRWNSMCADCHSTNTRKGFDLDQNRYETRWSEIDVACEACHGPGLAHVTWARGGADPKDAAKGLSVELSKQGEWRFDAGEPIARNADRPTPSAELDTCAACHSRRSRIAAGSPGAPFMDVYRPALLDEDLYHADGQILAEVYVWGSFLQSRMHEAGVVCSDCHDPHALRIEDPDAACAKCHRAESFAVPDHHHHAEDSVGASCVACHMPARTYMQVDSRRDHSFRVPRPDLTESIGVPNACEDCHPDQPASWASGTIASWYGARSGSTPHYGALLEAGRRRSVGTIHGRRS